MSGDREGSAGARLRRTLRARAPVEPSPVRAAFRLAPARLAPPLRTVAREPPGWRRSMTERARHHRPPRPPRQERSGKALVDGSNVAHSSEGGEGRLRNIELVVDKLREDGFDPIVVADAALRH